MAVAKIAPGAHRSVASAGADLDQLVERANSRNAVRVKTGMAGPVMMVAYALVSLGAILRVAALFVPGRFVALVIASGAAWTFAFAVFLAGYLPILLEPRGSQP